MVIYLLVLVIVCRGIYRLNWAKFFGRCMYYGFRLLSWATGEKPNKAYYLDKSGLWKVPTE